MMLRDEILGLLDHLGSTVTLGRARRKEGLRDVVMLRHDIDHDMGLALEMAALEHERGMRATYALLHTAGYFRGEDLGVQVRQLLAYGHEVALHTNPVGVWAEGRDPAGEIGWALARLRGFGARVTGVVAHGDKRCYSIGCANDWVWKELRPADPKGALHNRSAEGATIDDPAWRVAYPEGHVVEHGGRRLALWSMRMRDYGIRYEGAVLARDRYWTDSGGSWARSGDPRGADLSRGRHMVLVHPWWWKAEQRTVVALCADAETGARAARWVDRTTGARARVEGDRVVVSTPPHAHSSEVETVRIRARGDGRGVAAGGAHPHDGAVVDHPRWAWLSARQRATVVDDGAGEAGGVREIRARTAARLGVRLGEAVGAMAHPVLVERARAAEPPVEVVRGDEAFGASLWRGAERLGRVSGRELGFRSGGRYARRVGRGGRGARYVLEVGETSSPVIRVAYPGWVVGDDRYALVRVRVRTETGLRVFTDAVDDAAGRVDRREHAGVERLGAEVELRLVHVAPRGFGRVSVLLMGDRDAAGAVVWVRAVEVRGVKVGAFGAGFGRIEVDGAGESGMGHPDGGDGRSAGTARAPVVPGVTGGAQRSGS